MAKIETAVENLAAEILKQTPEFELVDVDYVKEGGNFILRIFIDKSGGVGLEDCQKFSELLGDALDRDPTLTSMLSDNYLLEVSSPGIDRVLKKDRDFIRERGKLIDVKLFAPIENSNGSKNFMGKLINMEEKILTLEINDNSTMKIPMKDIAQIRLHIDF